MNRPGRFISRRAVEVGMALAGAAFGGIVVVGALRHDVGWGPTGPGAGYFPLRIGLLLMGVATLLLLRAFWVSTSARFAEAGSLRRVAALLLPTAIFAASIVPLGAYLTMFSYLLWMARFQARRGWPVALALAIGMPAALFLLFETWLGVPLAKGPLEEALGIY